MPRHAPLTASPHVVTLESADAGASLVAWRASCALCGARSPWSALLSEAASSVWFAPMTRR